MDTPDEKAASAAKRARYRHRLRQRSSAVRGLALAGLEGAVGDGPANEAFSPRAIDQRMLETEAALHRIVKDLLGDEPGLHDIASQLVKQGGTALRRLADDDEALNEDGEALGHLEAIVQTDGSRPSFLVRDGKIDGTSSPAGTWLDTLAPSADLLAQASACVGRIELAGKHVGTGFLVHENLILTNRHVLQELAARDDDKVWRFSPEATIDFGREFRATKSLNPRMLQRVLFFGAEPIKQGPIDHNRLDLVLVELEPRPAGAPPLKTMGVCSAPDWATPPTMVVTIGYAGSPELGVYPSTLLEQLFKSTYGHKRLAPGLIMPPHKVLPEWSLSHDATTLGGNSGSLVVMVGKEDFAAGIHYGGRRGDLAENWGHVLGGVLGTASAPLAVTDVGGKTLREWLEQHGVPIQDLFA